MALQDWIGGYSGSFSEAGVRDLVDRVRNELAGARGRALMLPTVYRRAELPQVGRVLYDTDVRCAAAPRDGTR